MTLDDQRLKITDVRIVHGPRGPRFVILGSGEIDESAVDALSRVAAGPSCPACGSTLSIESLANEVEALRAEKAAQPKSPPPSAPLGIGPHALNFINAGICDNASKGYVDVELAAKEFSGSEPIRVDGMLTCADCGTWFRADARDRAEALRDEIRELKLELRSAIDLLGEVGEADPTE